MFWALCIKNYATYRIFKSQKKLYIANLVTGVFILNTWHFKNDKTLQLESQLEDDHDDLQTFGFTDKLRIVGENFGKIMVDSGIIVEKSIFKYERNLERNRRILNT